MSDEPATRGRCFYRQHSSQPLRAISFRNKSYLVFAEDSTSDSCSNPGPGITTEHARIPALDRECRMRVLRRPSFRSNGIAFLRTAALPRLQSSAVSITNIGWRELLREGHLLSKTSRIDYLRRTGDHRRPRC